MPAATKPNAGCASTSRRISTATPTSAPRRSCRAALTASTQLWESARLYLYLRSTGDGRLLVGGEDDDRDIPARRDRLVDRKAATLERKISWLFPHLHAQPAFAWVGVSVRVIIDPAAICGVFLP
ncbi:FAD-dependent oxidoreductase [Halomonas kalidii]|uniref:FAD-dependent oxidoreductase n=1 Tax=Halomonas kalidii TaxID=3043293 RepID=UPI002DD67333|nr:FAD-dependent oxidoreductase [Halomonas kalidii]